MLEIAGNPDPVDIRLVTEHYGFQRLQVVCLVMVGVLFNLNLSMTCLLRSVDHVSVKNTIKKGTALKLHVKTTAAAE